MKKIVTALFLAGVWISGCNNSPEKDKDEFDQYGFKPKNEELQKLIVGEWKLIKQITSTNDTLLVSDGESLEFFPNWQVPSDKKNAIIGEYWESIRNWHLPNDNKNTIIYRIDTTHLYYYFFINNEEYIKMNDHIYAYSLNNGELTINYPRIYSEYVLFIPNIQKEIYIY